MERFEKIFTKACDTIVLYVCGSIMLGMILYVSANVFSRYVLREGGVTGCYTYVGVSLVPLVYLCLAYGWYKKSYIVVNILQFRLKGKVLWGFQFAILFITLILFSGILFVGTFMDIFSSYSTGRAVGVPDLYSPQWLWKTTITIGFFLMAIRNVLDMITMVRTGQVIPNKR